MALAKKCDRCGTLYEHYKKENHIRIGETVVDGTTMCAFKDYDLCPDCMNWLQRWISCKGKLKEAE